MTTHSRLTERFQAIADHARLIPGVHRYCDEWCDYCHVRERCLAYCCRQEFCRARRLRPDRPIPRDDARVFSRALVSVDRDLPTDVGSTCDPDARVDAVIVSRALEYRRRSALLAEAVGAPVSRAAGEPLALDAVIRFHSAIYFKTTRAVVRGAMAANGLAVGDETAAACAARALSYARRSRAGLTALPVEDAERRSVVSVLDDLVARLQDRFPAARALSALASDARLLTKDTHGSNPREI